MTISHPLTGTLSQMPALAELFRLFLSGKHLNRLAEPALWAELEQQEDSYTALFVALGFDLRLDARGFAWFNSKSCWTLRACTLMLFKICWFAPATWASPWPSQTAGDCCLRCAATLTTSKAWH